jgi:hypothetical protein
MSTHRSVINKLHHWHQQPVGLLTFAVIELGGFYATGSLAIDTGSFWYYGAGIVLLLGAVHNLGKLLIRLAPKKK